MSHEAFEAYLPRGASREIVEQADRIIEEYQADGLVLTLRQLYYQFVSRDLITNTDKSYKRLGSIVAKARMGGLLPWDAIEDRARRPVRWAEERRAQTAVDKALQRFRLPRLRGQPTYVELWVEKDALAGVLEPLAAEYHVTLMVNRGYSSISAMKEAGDRVRASCVSYGSQSAAILYLGDLDPSGEDMVRDIRERLDLFLNAGRLIDWAATGEHVEDIDAQRDRKPRIPLRVEKLALTIEQVDEYGPPPNPAKLTDSRAEAFIRKYGPESWEVDALPPPVLRDVIRQGLAKHLDLERMEKVKAEEELERTLIREAIERSRP